MTAVSSAALAEQVRAALPPRRRRPLGHEAQDSTHTTDVMLGRTGHDPHAALDRLVTDLDSERQARENAERERDEMRIVLKEQELENERIVEAVWRSLPEHGGTCPNIDKPAPAASGPCLRCRVLREMNAAFVSAEAFPYLPAESPS